MEPIAGIREKVARDQFEFSKHAVDQGIKRAITVAGIKESIATGEMIEDYPTDKYGPSCLIFGRSGAGRPIHVQCSYASRDLIKIITLYEPDRARWIDFRRRMP